MKSIKKIFSFILILTLLVGTMASCGDKGVYHVFGLHYDLGKDFTKIDVPYSENCYTDGVMYFFFSVFNAEQLDEMGVDGNITVERYMQKFLVWNFQEPTNYEYDAEKNVARAHYVSSDLLVPEDAGESEPEYFYTVVLRGTSHLYVINMSCDVEDKDSCLPRFAEIADSLYAD